MALISLLIIGIFTSEDKFTAVYFSGGVFPVQELRVALSENTQTMSSSPVRDQNTSPSLAPAHFRITHVPSLVRFVHCLVPTPASTLSGLTYANLSDFRDEVMVR
jgi:hypothetical protein